MFTLIKQVFIVLLSCSSSLATKYLSLNNEPCLTRPTLIDDIPVQLNYYPFMISLVEVIMSYLQKYVLQKKDISVKVFNIITNKNKAKTMAKYISCDFKCKFNSTTCNSN